MREVKGLSLQSQKQFLKFTQEYEDTNLMCYEANMPERMIFELAAKKPDIVAAFKNVRDNLWNPFDWIFYWCKGEIYDLKALVFAVEQRAGLEGRLRRTTTKKLEATEDLGRVQEGKTSIRTVFKSKEDASAMKVQIESSEREIENLEVLSDLVTIHLGKDVIPTFKKNKLKIYRQMIKSLGKIEIQNAHAVASMWSLLG